jgi:hypothetical protein
MQNQRLANGAGLAYADPARHTRNKPMTETANQFKKAPKRKKEKTRSVSVSPEMRQVYADLIKDREAKENYNKHLPANDSRK